MLIGFRPPKEGGVWSSTDPIHLPLYNGRLLTQGAVRSSWPRDESCNLQCHLPLSTWTSRPFHSNFVVLGNLGSGPTKGLSEKPHSISSVTVSSHVLKIGTLYHFCTIERDRILEHTTPIQSFESKGYPVPLPLRSQRLRQTIDSISDTDIQSDTTPKHRHRHARAPRRNYNRHK